MKVYFNNSCKICKAEIDLYKKEKIDEIDWVDITDNDLDDKDFVRLRRKKNKIILLMYSIVLVMFVSSMSLLSKFLLFFTS